MAAESALKYLDPSAPSTEPVEVLGRRTTVGIIARGMYRGVTRKRWRQATAEERELYRRAAKVAARVLRDPAQQATMDDILATFENFGGPHARVLRQALRQGGSYGK